ncbi:MAG: zinc ABC transporter ATP-binding protein ZnuC [Pseudomonadota bacterium]
MMLDRLREPHIAPDREDALSTSTDLITAEGIGCFRSGRWLVHDVSLSVSRGEIVTIIGPNGSGKSTTAKLLLGLMTPDAGNVVRRPGLTIGYVPQELTIDQSMPLTVRRLMRLTGRRGRAEEDQALEAVGISHLANAHVQTLSGGEFQRALLARAIVRAPDLLVLDEPVQGVDFNGEIALYELISQLRDALGCGILLISHDLHIVMAQTDTVLCLNGHVCCHGTPNAVAENPEYLRLFGPRAADAIAVYRHHHDHAHATDGTVIPLNANAGACLQHGSDCGDNHTQNVANDTSSSDTGNTAKVKSDV